jgi:NAD(P)-dependent dehydrogenase (short-subunit alcohol dehydrogenase family)
MRVEVIDISNNLGISGNTAVVAAGRNGLNKATAEVFVAESVNVVINDISQDALEAAILELKAAAGDSAVVGAAQGDLTDNDDMFALIQNTVTTVGGSTISSSAPMVSGRGLSLRWRIPTGNSRSPCSSAASQSCW